ncbi:MAG: helix-turn-helix transcriptional regulator [Clostridiales bacterium]|nr:helix-turn-helix transcriptional regulator [Clostridiales bacterium]
MARMFDPELINSTTEITRLQILYLLSGGRELCAADIGSQFDLSQPTLSHHLNLLVQTGVLSMRKDGRKIYYSINKAKIGQIIGMFQMLVSDRASGRKTSGTAAPAKPAKAVRTAGKKASPKPAPASEAPASKSGKPGKDEKKSKKKKGEKDKKKKDKKKKK